MRPSTARHKIQDDQLADEELARKLAMDERLNSQGVSSTESEELNSYARPMTSRTKKRVEEDEAVAWQMQYEEELGLGRSPSVSTNSKQGQPKPPSVISSNYSNYIDVESSSSLSLEDHPPPVQLSFRETDSPSPDIDSSYPNHRSFNSEDLDHQLASEFVNIDNFVPKDVKIIPKLQCFIPDYTPAIGDLDPMIKVSAPSGYQFLNDKLGMEVLDEPSIHASDPAAVQIQVKSTMKIRGNNMMNAPVSSLDPKKTEFSRALAKWCQSVLDIHSKLNPDRVFYSKRMPAVEALMNEWRSPLGMDVDTNENTDEKWHKFQKKLFENNSFAELDASLEDSVRIACLLVDIPVYNTDKPDPSIDKSLIESLHVFFTLYLEFKNSLHFGKRV